jgi:hypothetical protein
MDGTRLATRKPGNVWEARGLGHDPRRAYKQPGSRRPCLERGFKRGGGVGVLRAKRAIGPKLEVEEIEG